MEDPESEALELRILRSIRRVIRAIDLESKRLETQYEITGPQLRCLAELSRSERETASRLARSLHLSASTVVGILDRLEQKGWVERERDASDRRVLWTRLTERGRDLLESAPSPLQEKLSQGLESLTALERATIALSLERLVGLIEAENLDAAPILETGPITPPNAKGT
ncbi:MAG: MarR family transcriptional regulator [Candidatus Eisenbacteria bacterium]|uniref:MarR family transcriptional regulator n=1 Tax=Eiseniibacteriota bacterium TaxID=2212470 RepID=A0A956NAV6_UNCEI|nr:MarR family transcriptional regulator [Candidatus Eisenbacteria bacterium]MCB9463518.1 MarR family transcriptional regulator [Candidatus Eisenbacteria bacterium]